MPLIDQEMTEKEAMDILNPAPRAKYLVKVFGLRTNEEGGYTFTAETGRKYEKVVFQIVEEGPHKGKFIKDYNNLHQTGFSAQLRRALPAAFTGSAMDTDLIVGMECFADVKITEYEGVERNEINRLYPLPPGA